MLHLHRTTTGARPDRVIATGVWQPFALTAGSQVNTQQTVHGFVSPLRVMAPTVSQEAAPEEVAMAANRLAIAMAAGKKVPKYVDTALVRAAMLINRGEQFTIKSAGRSVIVQPRQSVVTPSTRSVR